MAITIIQGTLGGGKTCRAVRMIVDHVRKGLTVYTNIDTVFPAIRKLVRAKWCVEVRRSQIRHLPPMEAVKAWVDFIDWGTDEAPILVVLDEAQCFWNSRDWAETQKHQTAMLSFLTQSRKANVDVVFISQSAGNVDKQFRELAEAILNCRNMAKVKIPIVDIPLLNVFRYQTIEISHMGVLRDTIIGAEWWLAMFGNRRYFACYRTKAFLDGFMNDLAAKKARVPKARLRPSFRWHGLADSLTDGDFVERWLGRLLRRVVARRARAWRRKRFLNLES